MKKILFVCSEIYPLIKTGGLADFAYSISLALKKLGAEPIVLIPAYRSVLQQLSNPKKLVKIALKESPFDTELLQAKIPGTSVKLWLVDTPALFDRAGGPYGDESGEPWADNDQRFCHLSRVAAKIASDELGLNWQPDVMHCNDWQTGLVPALLAEQALRPATIFTVHNLGYQGNFPQSSLYRLKLPPAWWDFTKLEFHDQLSFIKGGLVFADKITTVSPTYAKEILQPEQGYGLHGLLRNRQQQLTGILNGVDYQCWNPAKDSYIEYPYSIKTLDDKAKNKLKFQVTNHLSKGKSHLLIGFVARFAYQKGIDLLLDLIEYTTDLKVQWAILGNGEKHYEQALMNLQQRNPQKVFLSVDYNEALAHQIEASADLFIMPSYYEPCGLNQMYSLKYGTLPLVSNTGGLADTVIDATAERIADGSATGFMFEPGDTDSLHQAFERAAHCFRRKKTWKALQHNAMKQKFDWHKSAKAYLDLYDSAGKSLK